MQIFYMFIGRDTLCLYEKTDKGYERQYIAGNPEFHYQISNAEKDIKKLLDMLVEEYNLEDRSELTFFLIENEDSSITETVCRAFDNNICKRVDLGSILPKTIKEMEADKVPLIKEYGINVDGKNYLLTDGKLNKRDYSLLGYTLSVDKIMESID